MVDVATDDGRVKAIFQILYGQYYKWIHTVCRKNNQVHFPMDKNCADSLAENTPNASKIFSPKVTDF